MVGTNHEYPSPYPATGSNLVGANHILRDALRFDSRDNAVENFRDDPLTTLQAEIECEMRNFQDASAIT